MHIQKMNKYCKEKKCILCLSLYTILLCALVLKFIHKDDVPNCPSFYSKEFSSWSLEKQHKALKTKIFERFKNISIQHHLGDSEEVSHKKWVQVSPATFVYSAYIDLCQSAHSFSQPFCVKFIGATLSSKPDLDSSISNVACAFKNENGTVLKIGFAAVEKVPESHDKMYTATLFYCALYDSDRKYWPRYVSLFEGHDINAWIPVQKVSSAFPSMDHQDIYINICVRPFYGQVSITALSEFIAYYSVIGAEHFTFYYMNKTESLSEFVNLMRVFNISLDYMQWNIPLDNSEIHEFGQIAFTQECIARSQFVFTHTAIVDIDEFIVPSKHDNLKTFLTDLDSEHKDAGSYVIHNVLFCYEYPLDRFSALNIFIHNKRQKTVWQHWYRSKYIFRPDRLRQGGVHFVWKHEDGRHEVRLSPEEALLHHYRSCCGLSQTWLLHLLSFNVLDDDVVRDDTLIAKWKNQIYAHKLIRFIYNVSIEEEPTALVNEQEIFAN